MIARTVHQATLVCALMVFAFAGRVPAQEKDRTSPSFKSSISIDSDKLEPQKAAIVSVTIENKTGREIDLKAICSFELLRIADDVIARNFSARADGYWSPLNVSSSTPLKLMTNPKMLKHGIVEGRVPQEVLHFEKDEAKVFKADLTKLFWNDRILSDWPRWNLFEVVPRGRYWLQFTTGSNNNLESNRIEVSVE